MTTSNQCQDCIPQLKCTLPLNHEGEHCDEWCNVAWSRTIANACKPRGGPLRPHWYGRGKRHFELPKYAILYAGYWHKLKPYPFQPASF